MSSAVHIEYIAGVKYPEWDEHTCYAPAREYPEFAGKDILGDLSGQNEVYDMVRNTFLGLGMDREHFGTKEWNPFRDLITAGQTVLVKPNMVCHKNGNADFGLDCLVTHPSLVRAVLDYVALALDGSGRMILADAPVQSCDFGILVKELHYDRLAEHFSRKGIVVELMDLRQLEEAYLKTTYEGARFRAKSKEIVVNMGEDSAFCAGKAEENAAGKLRITNYLPEYMEEYHKESVHKYAVADVVLQADVIINLPKPKTHRKAGMTASLKNMVGCVAKKECLPHHTQGSKKECGDEYLKKSVFKRWRTELEEKNDRRIARGRKKSKAIGLVQILLYKAAKLRRADQYTEGSWYGNDTLWRTICDICRVVMYADKNGIMQRERQRKMLIIADMIVAGEGDGPLCPRPKQVGMLVGGWEQITTDEVIASLMGFLPEKFPAVTKAGYGKTYRLPQSEPEISSNDAALCKKTLPEIRGKVSPFIPTDGWAEWLEDSV